MSFGDVSQAQLDLAIHLLQQQQQLLGRVPARLEAPSWLSCVRELFVCHGYQHINGRRSSDHLTREMLARDLQTCEHTSSEETTAEKRWLVTLLDESTSPNRTTLASLGALHAADLLAFEVGQQLIWHEHFCCGTQTAFFDAPLKARAALQLALMWAAHGAPSHQGTDDGTDVHKIFARGGAVSTPGDTIESQFERCINSMQTDPLRCLAAAEEVHCSLSSCKHLPHQPTFAFCRVRCA